MKQNAQGQGNWQVGEINYITDATCCFCDIRVYTGSGKKHFVNQGNSQNRCQIIQDVPLQMHCNRAMHRLREVGKQNRICITDTTTCYIIFTITATLEYIQQASLEKLQLISEISQKCAMHSVNYICMCPELRLSFHIRSIQFSLCFSATEPLSPSGDHC